MNIATFLIVLMVFWVIFLFIVLPFGVKIPEKPEIGMADSAPIKPRISLKLFLSLLMALVMTFIYWYIVATYPTIFDFLKHKQ